VLASGGVDAEAALADLVDVSRDVEAAMVLLPDGRVAASGFPDERAEAFAAAVRKVVAAAEHMKPGEEAPLTRLDARLRGEALVIVRDGDRLAAATARATAPAALVAYDLNACLRSVETDAILESADAPA
jgi:Roadblock/LC7 domain